VIDAWTIYPLVGFACVAVLWWLDRWREIKRRQAKDRRFIFWGIVAAAAIAWNVASPHWSPKDKTLIDREVSAAETAPAVTGALRHHVIDIAAARRPGSSSK
jgi:hypothetical protein